MSLRDPKNRPIHERPRLNTPIARPIYVKMASAPKGNADVPLTKKERFRRVTLLCCHFVRNLAYDQAGRKSIIELEEAGDFWATVLNNFLNCCVLEWCKLFVDTKKGNPGEHRWDNVVADKVRFEAEMFRQIDKTQFQTLKKAMREARNKFIAHLDDEKVEYTPYMNIAKDTVRFYHSYIVENADPGDLAGLPIELDDYYSACSREAEKIYARLVRSW